MPRQETFGRDAAGVFLKSPVRSRAVGVISEEDIPPLYQTTVYYVGDKVLWDMHDMSVKERLERVRFISRHDDWDSFGSEHFDVVDMVEEGEVDLSKPVSEA